MMTPRTLSIALASFLIGATLGSPLLYGVTPFLAANAAERIRVEVDLNGAPEPPAPAVKWAVASQDYEPIEGEGNDAFTVLPGPHTLSITPPAGFKVIKIDGYKNGELTTTVENRRTITRTLTEETTDVRVVVWLEALPPVMVSVTAEVLGDPKAGVKAVVTDGWGREHVIDKTPTTLGLVPGTTFIQYKLSEGPVGGSVTTSSRSTCVDPPPISKNADVGGRISFSTIVDFERCADRRSYTQRRNVGRRDTFSRLSSRARREDPEGAADVDPCYDTAHDSRNKGNSIGKIDATTDALRERDRLVERRRQQRMSIIEKGRQFLNITRGGSRPSVSTRPPRRRD